MAAAVPRGDSGHDLALGTPLSRCTLVRRPRPGRTPRTRLTAWVDGTRRDATGKGECASGDIVARGTAGSIDNTSYKMPRVPRRPPAAVTYRSPVGRPALSLIGRLLVQLDHASPYCITLCVGFRQRPQPPSPPGKKSTRPLDGNSRGKFVDPHVFLF